MDAVRTRRRLALVTGASTGLGRGIALELADRDIDLIVVARGEVQLHELAIVCRAKGVQVQVEAIDLCAPGRIEQLAARVGERGGLDILVNNAGIASYGWFADQELDTILRVIDLNVRVLTELTYRLLPALIEARGHLLNVASVAGLQPSPRFLPYAATKAYIIMLSEALQYELRAKGVQVTTFCPSSLDTPFLTKTGMQRSRAVTLLPVHTPERAAAIAVKAMISGRSFVVPGLLNNVIAAAIGVSPRFLQKLSVDYFLAER